VRCRACASSRNVDGQPCSYTHRVIQSSTRSCFGVRLAAPGLIGWFLRSDQTPIVLTRMILSPFFLSGSSQNIGQAPSPAPPAARAFARGHRELLTPALFRRQNGRSGRRWQVSALSLRQRDVARARVRRGGQASTSPGARQARNEATPRQSRHCRVDQRFTRRPHGLAHRGTLATALRGAILQAAHHEGI
jgi:hypothetical protein